MNFEHKSIEEFFLTSLLRTSIGGTLLILFTDAIVFPEDTLSVTIDAIIIAACWLSYLIRRRHSVLSILIFTTIILAAMFYQCMRVPINTTTSLSVILVVGFIFSVLLEGKIMWAMHGITFLVLQAIFILQYSTPKLQFAKTANEIITVGITYSILYFILTYASGVLKLRYDRINVSLKTANLDLHEKAKEIEAQNEELIQTQDNLNALNLNLEKVVHERTDRIQAQNEMLIKYSYTNAHDLRGPVARLLGLAEVYKIDSGLDKNFIVDRMVDQAREIDTVIRRISEDLAGNTITH